MDKSLFFEQTADILRFLIRLVRPCRKRKKRLDQGSNPGLPQFMKGALTTELPSNFVEDREVLSQGFVNAYGQ